MRAKRSIRHVAKVRGQKSRKTRALILSTAARHFREKGYANSKLKEIAAAVGIEAGSIFYYFTSKEDLLDEVIEVGCSDVIDAISTVIRDCEARGADFRETFASMVYSHLLHILRASDFTSAIMRNFSMLPMQVRERHQVTFDSYVNLWAEEFMKAQKTHQLRSDVNISSLQRLVVGTLNWTVEWFDTEHFSIREFADTTTSLILDGMLYPNATWCGREAARIPLEPMSLNVAALPKATRTRMQILLSTARTLHEKGYDGVTLRHIAETAGMKAGSIYYHFSSKEEIIDEVLLLGLVEIVEGVTAELENKAMFSDSISRIASGVSAHMLYLFVRSDFVSMSIRIHAQLPLEVREQYRPLRQQYALAWSKCLRQAQAGGEIRADLDIIQVRQLVIGSLNWTANWFEPDWNNEKGSKSLDDLINMILTVFLDGVAVSGSGKGLLKS